MAVTITFYNNFKLRQLNGNAIDLDTDTVKAALCTSSYTPDIDAHDFFDDITSEVSGTGYTAGGATVGSKTLTLDTANNRVVWDAADVTWASSSITARYAILYEDTGTPATSGLIAVIDFGTDFSTSLSTFIIPWNADGIARLT